MERSRGNILIELVRKSLQRGWVEWSAVCDLEFLSYGLDNRRCFTRRNFSAECTIKPNKQGFSSERKRLVSNFRYELPAWNARHFSLETEICMDLNVSAWRYNLILLALGVHIGWNYYLWAAQQLTEFLRRKLICLGFLWTHGIYLFLSLQNTEYWFTRVKISSLGNICK